MTDFKKIYLHIFNKVTDAIDLLQAAQRECEELYIQSAAPIITIHGEEKEQD